MSHHLARKLKVPPDPDAVSSAAERLAKLINDHPFPARPLLPLLKRHFCPALPSPALLESVLGRLFRGHSSSLKALELFRFSLRRPGLPPPTPPAFDAALHAVARARDFDRAWDLLEEVRVIHPSLISRRSLAIVLSRYAKFQSFDDTMAAFDRMETQVFAGREFGVDEFNMLLKAFCAQRRMLEARAVFRKLYSRFNPNTRTMNTLLLGFKETRNVLALDLFYHEMILRGFIPDVVTFNIRIDAYCKKGKMHDAIQLLEEMEKNKCPPTLETMTTLVHGACIARNPHLARRLFDEMLTRNLQPDTGAYNALMTSLVRSRDITNAIELMKEMETIGIEHDDRTYYIMFWGLKKFGDVDSVCKLYWRMVEKGFVPKVRTVVSLMKFFCENRRTDMGQDLWGYMVNKGCCPHGHALDLLVTALCCRGMVGDAYECFKQVVERGRRPTERGFRVMEGFLVREGWTKKLEELTAMLLQLQSTGLSSVRRDPSCISTACKS